MIWYTAPLRGVKSYCAAVTYCGGDYASGGSPPAPLRGLDKVTVPPQFTVGVTMPAGAPCLVNLHNKRGKRLL